MLVELRRRNGAISRRFALALTVGNRLVTGTTPAPTARRAEELDPLTGPAGVLLRENTSISTDRALLVRDCSVANPFAVLRIFCGLRRAIGIARAVVLGRAGSSRVGRILRTSGGGLRELLLGIGRGYLCARAVDSQIHNHQYDETGQDNGWADMVVGTFFAAARIRPFIIQCRADHVTALINMRSETRPAPVYNASMRLIRLDSGTFGNALYAVSALLLADGILMALLLAGSLPFDRGILLEVHALTAFLVFVVAVAAVSRLTMPHRGRPVLALLAFSLLVAFNPFYPLVLTTKHALAASILAAIVFLGLADRMRTN